MSLGEFESRNPVTERKLQLSLPTWPFDLHRGPIKGWLRATVTLPIVPHFGVRELPPKLSDFKFPHTYPLPHRLVLKIKW